MEQTPDKPSSLKWHITPSIKDGKAIIDSCTEWNGVRDRVTRSVLDTKDEAIRQCLIVMGWSPPPKTPSCLHDNWYFGENGRHVCADCGAIGRLVEVRKWEVPN